MQYIYFDKHSILHWLISNNRNITDKSILTHQYNLGVYEIEIKDTNSILIALLEININSDRKYNSKPTLISLYTEPKKFSNKNMKFYFINKIVTTYDFNNKEIKFWHVRSNTNDYHSYSLGFSSYRAREGQSAKMCIVVFKINFSSMP